jgi:hypothetical protein
MNMSNNKNIAQRGSKVIVPKSLVEDFSVLSKSEMERLKKKEKSQQKQLKALREQVALRNAAGLKVMVPKNLRGAGAYAMRTPEQLAEMTHDYLLSIMDPFGHRGVRVPSAIALPTSVFSTTQIQEFELTTTSEPGTLRVYAPLNYNAVWASSGTQGSTGNTKLNPGYEGHRYRLYGSAWDAKMYPTDVGNTTNIGTLDYLLTSGRVTTDMWAVQSCSLDELYTDVVKLYSHVRKVSAGLRVTYMGEPLSAKGRVAVAQLPPGINLPIFDATAATITNAAGFMTPAEFDFSFDQIALLPGAKIYEASEQFTAVLKPYDEDCEIWGPTKYNSIFRAFDNSVCFGEEAFPPFVNDPIGNRAVAQAYQARASFSTSDANIYGNLMRQQAFLCNTGSWGTIVIMYEGADVTGNISVEFTANYEGVPESRSLSLIQPRRGHSATKDAAAHAREVAHHLPDSFPTHSGLAHKLSRFLKGAVRQGAAAIGAAGGGRAVASTFAAKIGAELPEIAGDILEGAAVVGALL